MHREILFSEAEIAEKVKALARVIAAAPVKPHIAAPILSGAYVFAADLLRALTYEGYSLPVEFLWLRSYAGRESSRSMKVLVAPSENFRGRNILLIDGVLDGGNTLRKARELALQYGASNVMSVVLVDKTRAGAVAKADFAGFTGIADYIVGYGMDDAGAGRALPYIAKAG
jgi:hypoxanthine phosphoribosyltransferase